LDGANGRLGFRSGARGGHPVAQRSREEAATAGVGHGAGAAGLLPRVTVGKEGVQGKEIRYDRWGPLVSETRWEMGRRFGGLKRGRWAGGLVNPRGRLGVV
jgi:hypothetical protein